MTGQLKSPSTPPTGRLSRIRRWWRNQEVAGGARRPVEADAKARQEIVGVHRELGAERFRLDTSWKSLKDWSGNRSLVRKRTESVLAPVIQLVGGLAIVVMLLGFCRTLVAARRNEVTDAELNEFLVVSFFRASSFSHTQAHSCQLCLPRSSQIMAAPTNKSSAFLVGERSISY